MVILKGNFFIIYIGSVWIDWNLICSLRREHWSQTHGLNLQKESTGRKADPSGESRSYWDCLPGNGWNCYYLNVWTLLHLILPEVQKISFERLYFYIHSFLLPDWPFVGQPGDNPVPEHLLIFIKNTASWIVTRLLSEKVLGSPRKILYFNPNL